MPKPTRPTTIAVTSPDGETLRITVPPGPKLTLLERLSWWTHCVRLGLRNWRHNRRRRKAGC